MSLNVAPIVEGHGEVVALPILLRRLMNWKTPGVVAHVPTPIRVRKDRFLARNDEFRRYLWLADRKCAQNGWILILLDADDDCPAHRGPEIQQRAQECVPNRPVSVVLAMREYEAWFIAAAQSLHGHRGFMADSTETVDAEGIRDAKGWIGDRMVGSGYGEVLDQPAFSATFDLEQAHDRSRSFRKLCSDWKVKVEQTKGS
jgi:hypothetical protein